MDIDKQLIEKLKIFNEFLVDNYQSKISKDRVKPILSELGVIKTILQGDTKDENLLGVDGSYNSYGANYPHQLWMFRGLAKATRGGQAIQSDILTPLDQQFRKKVELFSKARNISPYDGVGFFVKEKLAEMELDVAIQGAIDLKPSVIFMDGSLVRYKIESEKKWEKLKKIILDEGILLAGVIEEIGTKNLTNYLNLGEVYDREIMFGVLDIGEQFILKEQVKEGFITAFVRPGEDPQPIAIDCLLEQRGYMDKLISLAASLTPRKGRGIPLWLDIVDSEVRITNKVVDGLVENYISPDLRYKLLTGKRRERWF